MKIKLCGLTRPCDVAWANETRPDFAGFVFAGVKRRISPQLAGILRRQLHVSIAAVGVFADAAAAAERAAQHAEKGRQPGAFGHFRAVQV